MVDQVFTLEEITAAVEKHKPRVLGLVHAETSTGACQPFDGIHSHLHIHARKYSRMPNPPLALSSPFIPLIFAHACTYKIAGAISCYLIWLSISSVLVWDTLV